MRGLVYQFKHAVLVDHLSGTNINKKVKKIRAENIYDYFMEHIEEAKCLEVNTLVR